MNIVQLFTTRLAAFRVKHGEFCKEQVCHIGFAGLPRIVRVFV